MAVTLAACAIACLYWITRRETNICAGTDVKMSMIGEHQLKNAATAAAAAHVLQQTGFSKLTRQAVCAGLAQAVLPGRCQVMHVTEKVCGPLTACVYALLWRIIDATHDADPLFIWPFTISAFDLTATILNPTVRQPASAVILALFECMVLTGVLMQCTYLVLCHARTAVHLPLSHCALRPCHDNTPKRAHVYLQHMQAVLHV